MRPLHFALLASPNGQLADWRSLARRAEEAGFSAVYVSDHIGPRWSPLQALQAAAEATSRLALGTCVLNNDFRHPLVLAQELATLAAVVDRPLDVGVGAGWMRRDYDRLGRSMDPPGQRIDRLAEAVRILRAALWGQGAGGESGPYYRVVLRDAARPRPPRQFRLLIGGGGRRILSLAARESDIVGLNVELGRGQLDPIALGQSSIDVRVSERVRWVREAAGPRLREFELQCLPLVVCADARVRERLVSYGLSDMSGPSPMVLAGSLDEVCEAVLRYRRTLGISSWVFRDADREDAERIVARLAGR